jgi:hypothetical protein
MYSEKKVKNHQSNLYKNSLQHSIYGSLDTNITSTATDGLWSQITDDHKNVYRSPTTLLEERIYKLELDNKLLRLKILGMEGKFTQEEISNIRKMMMSKDEASKTLAESIIENT